MDKLRAGGCLAVWVWCVVAVLGEDFDPFFENLEARGNFDTVYKWSYVNYTWPSYEAYANAVTTRRYIPENNAMAGVKYYKGKFYIALPKLRRGVPVTLAYFKSSDYHYYNLPLTPYPSWEMNERKECNSSLQSVQSMEIDTKGVMWVLDGARLTDVVKCPTKLVLLDLNDKGKVLRTFEFPEHLSSAVDGFLNDIVVDETDGGYAYITEHSFVDPGIIVYSRLQNRAWKIRDESMFPEVEASNFLVDDLKHYPLSPVDGIALSPVSVAPKKPRTLFYCSLTGYYLFAISSATLKDELRCKLGEFRRDVRFVGKKQSQSDGLVIDNRGNMYYGLLADYGIGHWNIHQPFKTSEVAYQNEQTLIWPDSFAFDDNGYLHVLANGIHKFANQTYPLKLTKEIKFRILRTYTGSKSYLFKYETEKGLL